MEQRLNRVLNNGIKIPAIGFGTWRLNDDEAYENVQNALQCGYRLIDTAAYYKNENGVGRAILEAALAREEIFVTSKLWNDDQGYKATLAAFKKTMERLKLDYLDLYLVHWPIPMQHQDDWRENMKDTWKAMEELYASGRVKAIGVSNFMAHHLECLLDSAKILPAINQIEYHPGCLQEETVRYCNTKNIQLEAWGPLARGEALRVGKMEEIARKYHKTTAQICLHWEVQKGIIPIPKTSNLLRMQENIDIFDFELTKQELVELDAVDQCHGPQHDPDHLTF